MNWTKIDDESPEEERLLLYFFECTGVSIGFYYGRDENYPSSNNHVFGGQGFLTGDVTHWCHIDYPEGEDGERRRKSDLEFFKETKEEIFKLKEPIG